MVVVRASKLDLPDSSFSSLLYDPTSLSLALIHSDSSLSLYHSLSPPSSSLLSLPRTLIPPPSSSSCFLSTGDPHSSHPRPLFLVSAPSNGGSKISLRFFVLGPGQGFSQARVVCNHKGFESVDGFGVLLDCVHGISLKLAGSANFFAVNWVAGSEVWVFAARLVDDGVVKLMRCAVIECARPVFSVGVCFGLLVLGEESGVRVFSLRQLVKGRGRKEDSRLERRKLRLPNGVVGDNVGRIRDLGNLCGRCESGEGNSEIACDCSLDEKSHRNLTSYGKQKAIRLQQDSSEVGTCFVTFSSRNVEASKSREVKSLKATSIQALSPKKFLILDSSGNLHLVCLGSAMTPQIQELPRVINVQKLAVVADNSTGAQNIWVSDGYHSLHMITLPDMEAMANETDRTEKQENLVQISVKQTIFSGEKIEDVTPLAANAILILGQGGLYAYDIS